VIRQRPRNPIVPQNKSDRTGSAGIVRRACAQVRRRFEGLRKDLLAIFDRIPVYAMNDVRSPEVRYGLTADQLAGIADELSATLQRWIGAERDPANMMWWEPFDEEASQLGTAQSVANLRNISPVYAAARDLAQVIYSDAYRTRVRIAKFRSNEYWTGLAADQRQKLAEVIGRAVVDGKNPRVVRKEIQETLDVGKARALLFAQTDVTNTLREARVAEAEYAQAALGIKTALLWTSALLPTTRPWHASRSGRTYTPAEVKAFYAQGGNRFNCYCSTTECLLDEEGKPILTKKLQSAMANERKAWQALHGKKTSP
jgi:uncharacterized protein with gpF-like domain